MLQKQIYMKYTLWNYRSKMLIDADVIIFDKFSDKRVVLRNISLRLNGSQ